MTGTSGRVWVPVAVSVVCVGCVGPDVHFEGTGLQRTTGAATVCVHEFEDLRPTFEHNCGFAGPGVYPTDDSRFDQPVPKLVADALGERLTRAGFRVVRNGPADYDLRGKLLHYQIIENLNLLTIVPHPAILLTQRDWFDAHVECQVDLTRRSDGACLVRRSFAVHHKKHVPVGLLYLNRVERGWGYVMRRLALYGWFVAGAISDRVVAAVDPGQAEWAALNRPVTRTRPLYETELTELASAARARAPQARQARSAPATVQVASVARARPTVAMAQPVTVRQVGQTKSRGGIRFGPRQVTPRVQVTPVVQRSTPNAQRAVSVVQRTIAPAAPTQAVAVAPPAPQAVVVSAVDPARMRPASRFTPSTEWEPL